MSPALVCGIVAPHRIPAPSGLNTVASTGVDVVGDRQEHGIERKVEVGGVAAPQPGLDIDIDEAEHRREPVADATSVLAVEAGLAITAGLEHLDGHSLTFGDPPASGGVLADLLDDADDLVARDE